MKNQIEFLKCMIRSKVRDEKGATMVEYALMAALIAVVCALTVGQVGGAADTAFGAVRDAFTPPAP